MPSWPGHDSFIGVTNELPLVFAIDVPVALVGFLVSALAYRDPNQKDNISTGFVHEDFDLGAAF